MKAWSSSFWLLWFGALLWAAPELTDLEDLEPLVPLVEGKVSADNEMSRSGTTSQDVSSARDDWNISIPRPRRSGVENESTPASEGGVSSKRPELREATSIEQKRRSFDEVASLSATATSQGGKKEDVLGEKGDQELDGSGELSPPISASEAQLLELGEPELQKDFEPSLGKAGMLYFMLFLVGALFLFIWYQKQLKGKVKANPRLPLQLLGQTWLDGQTKILVVRVGAKVLVLAKSPQFCTTLDVISDPDEVNLITLSSGDEQGEFGKLLTSLGVKGKGSSKIPDAEGIQSDLRRLKEQLGAMQGEASSR